MVPFKDFQRFYSSHEKQYGQLVYIVHATETNQSIITSAIDEWANKRITAVSDEKFMANFWVGPKLCEYHTNPVLQQHDPPYAYQYTLKADSDA